MYHNELTHFCDQRVAPLRRRNYLHLHLQCAPRGRNTVFSRKKAGECNNALCLQHTFEPRSQSFQNVIVLSFQVQRLGTLMEALEPVPGLDPEAFFKVLKGGGCGVREQDLDYRDVKIVQLAKRSRALSAKLEGEKAR